MRTLASVALCVHLVACGFHLAGSRELPEPLRSVYIQANLPYSVDEPPVEAALRVRLRRRGGTVVGSPGQARSVLKLTDLTERREVLSVGRDGKALEFRLITSVNFSLYAGETLLLPPRTQVVSRDYSFRAEEILAKEAEEARLRRFIQDELAELILLRLDTELSRQPVYSPLPAAPTSDQ